METFVTFDRRIWGQSHSPDLAMTTEEMPQNETYYAYWALLVSNDPRLAVVGTCLNPFQAWIYASLCSALVGLTGLLPIVLLSDKVARWLKTKFRLYVLALSA